MITLANHLDDDLNGEKELGDKADYVNHVIHGSWWEWRGELKSLGINKI